MKRLNYSRDLYSKTGIYCITCLGNNKKYVGFSYVRINFRYLKHLGSLRKNNHVNKYLQNSFNKYGESLFTFEIIEFIDNSHFNIDYFKQREIYYIEKYDSYKNGLNATMGGDYNSQFTVVYSFKIIKSELGIKFKKLKSYNGGSEAALDFNYCPSSMWRYIRCEIKSKKLKDYIFFN